VIYVISTSNFWEKYRFSVNRFSSKTHLKYSITFCLAKNIGMWLFNNLNIVILGLFVLEIFNLEFGWGLVHPPHIWHNLSLSNILILSNPYCNAMDVFCHRKFRPSLTFNATMGKEGSVTDDEKNRKSSHRFIQVALMCGAFSYKLLLLLITQQKIFCWRLTACWAWFEWKNCLFWFAVPM